MKIQLNTLCLLIIAIFYVHNTKAQKCSPQTGPDGATHCVKLAQYDDYQWATCRTDKYLRKTSGGLHLCRKHLIHKFCLYQCMLEKYRQSSGRVFDRCRCNPNSASQKKTHILAHVAVLVSIFMFLF